MLPKLRSRLSYANVVSTICLFIVLGGSSYAAIKLPANSVGNKQLKKNAVTLKKIKRSTRKALKGQKGDTGPRGATGATGPRGLTGQRGAAGPGAVKLDWSPTGSPPTTTPLFSRDGLTVTGICNNTGTYPIVSLQFGASGSSATANATWTEELSDDPDTTFTHQDGVANGEVDVAFSTAGRAFRRAEGQAVLRSDTLVVSVAFHMIVLSGGSCKVDGTVTPAT